MYLSADPKKIANFKGWLTSAGAQVLQPTSQWEAARFRTSKGVSVLYQNKKGNLSYTGEALEAWDSFVSGTAWRADPATKRVNKGHVSYTIRERDGNRCFYCHEPVHEQEASIEHLVALTHGGPNHISNLFLTHRKCNENAGTLSAPEKIALHVLMLTKRKT